MAVRISLLILGLIQGANGLWMLVAPDNWYWFVPGVSLTGPLNHHFVLDIGMAFLASGAGLAAGFARGARAAIFSAAGATFPALHALVHMRGWFMYGLPATVPTFESEIVGVAGLSLACVLIAWLRVKGEANVEGAPARTDPTHGARIRL